MKKLRHTPGPWQRGHRTETRIAIVAPREASAGTRTVAYVNIGPHEEEDAALIACAPEMLAMIEQYASECGECSGSGLSVTLTEAGEYGPDADCDQCADIRELLAKIKERRS